MRYIASTIPLTILSAVLHTVLMGFVIIMIIESLLIVIMWTSVSKIHVSSKASFSDQFFRIVGHPGAL